jgi:hypothetical protein
MTTLREAAQQALEALQAYGSHAPNCDYLVLLTSLPPQRKPCSCGLAANITALRAALAEPNHDYERGFVGGMSEQVRRDVERNVMASLDRFYAIAVAAEREACAKVCEEIRFPDSYTAIRCAAAIRARGET